MTGDVDSRKSLLRYFLTFSRRVVSWPFKLQQCVVLSIVEVESIVMTEEFSIRVRCEVRQLYCVLRQPYYYSFGISFEI